MSTAVPATSRLMVSERETKLAESVLDTLEGPQGFLTVATTSGGDLPLPAELGALLQKVLQAIAAGQAITVTAIPEELTTTAAAAMLGVSRPTLIKMIERGEIPSHKVGTHTRVTASDVLAARQGRRERERRAFEALQQLLDD